MVVKLAKMVFVLSTLILSFVYPVNSYNMPYVFTTTENEISNLSIYGGSFLLVDAFATWCDSCRTEMAHLEELYKAVGDQIQMLSLSVDPDDTIKKINDFKDEFNAKWDFGLDHESQFLHSYPLISFPQGYFFDSEGNLLTSWVGITSASKFLDDLKDYIDVPEGYDTNDELDLYVDEILTNPLFLITGSLLIIILIFNVTKRKQITVND